MQLQPKGLILLNAIKKKNLSDLHNRATLFLIESNRLKKIYGQKNSKRWRTDSKEGKTKPLWKIIYLSKSRAPEPHHTWLPFLMTVQWDSCALLSGGHLMKQSRSLVLIFTRRTQRYQLPPPR